VELVKVFCCQTQDEGVCFLLARGWILECLYFISSGGCCSMMLEGIENCQNPDCP
jgi:hypothetical protein